MSVRTQIDRLNAVKDRIRTNLVAHGIAVPSDTMLEEMATMILSVAGYTPQKGVDYWTDADQESIVQQVITALGTPVFGRVDAENNIILTGELADGTYTVKYESADGERVDVGTVNLASGPVEIPLVWEHGAVLDKTTGKVSQTGHAQYSASDYTAIDPTKSYTLTRDSYMHNTCNIIWCDSGMNFIRYDTTDLAPGDDAGAKGDLSRQLNPPANAAYLRLRLWCEICKTHPNDAAAYAAMYHLIEE